MWADERLHQTKKNLFKNGKINNKIKMTNDDDDDDDEEEKIQKFPVGFN